MHQWPRTSVSRRAGEASVGERVVIRETTSWVSCVGAAHGDGAGELGYLGNMGPGGREVAVERGTDLDAAHLYAPSLGIGGAGLFIARLGVSEIGGQIVIQGGLIGFDGQHSLSLPGVDQGHEVYLGMHGIGGVDASGHRETRQHLLGDGNARSFSPRRALGAGFPGCDGCKRTRDGALSALPWLRRGCSCHQGRWAHLLQLPGWPGSNRLRPTPDAPRSCEAASGDRANRSGTETD